jgi:hypothetical protein
VEFGSYRPVVFNKGGLMSEKFRNLRLKFVAGDQMYPEYFAELERMAEDKTEYVTALLESMSLDIDVNTYKGSAYKNDKVVETYTAEILRVVGL